MNTLRSVMSMAVLVSLAWDTSPGRLFDSQGNVLAGGDGHAVVNERPALATPNDRFFNSNGVRIRHVEEGQGPPVVLIHGYIANADRHWIDTGVFVKLAKDHRVVALDCRGHGKSDKPIEPEAYGLEMAKDVVRLLDHLKIRRAHIVGFSMGAFVAGYLVTTHADRLLSATLVGHHPIREWTAADEDEAHASARDLESDTPFRSLILAISPPDAVPSEDEIRALSQALVAGNDPKALAAYHRGRRSLAVTDAELKTVRVPTLAIIGSEDPALAGVQALTKIMPALRFVVVDGAAHGGERGVLRRPEFLAELRQFLATRR
jgi:pimeloyl-ACP methyl ester carboxylesterase